MADEQPQTAVLDQAAFEASLTTDDHKAFFANALKTAAEDAVTKFKTESEAARSKAVPEKYELKFAEKSPLDPQEDAEKIAAYCKQHHFTNEQAQAYVQQLEERASALTARQQADQLNTREAWKTQTIADKELGGEKLQETLAHTKRVMDRFAPEGSGFRQLLDESGYGNHPEFVRFIAKIGKTMAEDSPTILGGGGREGSTKDFDAKTLYPKSAMA
jgi:predicted RNase H-like nuclease (RuvC/YqgF family)